MSTRFRKSFAITKFDEETRTIEGIATAEVLDAHGEIVDYATAKDVISSTWPGNFREMHKAEAVGNGAVVECNDAEKTITVRGIVSKGAPNTWEKVKDGTLKMFSIGGLAKERRSEKIGDKACKRLIMERIDEVSLVDNGACPVAAFAIAKSIDGTLSGLEVDTVVEKLDMPEPWDVSRAAGLLASLNELLANEIWDMNSRMVNGQDAAAAQNQVNLLRQSAQYLMQFLQSEFAEQFAAAAADPAAAGTEAAAVVVETVSDDVAMARVADLAKAALSVLHTAGVAKAGARHSKKDQDMIQGVHDHSVGLGAACAPADDKAAKADKPKDDEKPAADAKDEKPADDKKKTDDEADDAKKLADQQTGAVVVKLADLPDVQKLFTDMQGVIETQKATVTAQAATIAGLETRLAVVEKQPAAGGPAVRIAEKAIGPSDASSSTASALTPEALTEVIKALEDGPVKDQLLIKLHSMNVAAGIGVTRIGGRP